MGKEYDIVVFGATGDTGRCMCHFLHNRGAELGITSWAASARNLEKLDKLLGDIANGNGTDKPEKGVLASPPIKADIGDYESMLAMAKQAKVVVACAGPYADMGEPVVKACVEAGTDYCDITGETPWVDVMAKKYGKEASEKGISIISQAAYDSVPSDITVALAALALEKEGEKIAAAETHHLLKGGALPVGTLKTLLNAVMQGRSNAVATLTMGYFGGPSAEEKAKLEDKKQEDMSLKKAPGLVPKDVKSAVKRDVGSNMTAGYTPLSGTWSFPSFMTSVNTPIVHTTAKALGYGADTNSKFTYRERLGEGSESAGSLYGFAPFAAKTLGLTVGACVAIPVVLPLVFMFPDKAREYAENFNNSDPGDAKAKAFSKLFNGFKKDGLTAVTGLGASVSGKKMAKVQFESDYDAGLGFTALSAITVAAAILDKRANGEEGKGFETAVAAVGPETLKEWYDKVGVRITVSVLPTSKL